MMGVRKQEAMAKLEQASEEKNSGDQKLILQAVAKPEHS